MRHALARSTSQQWNKVACVARYENATSLNSKIDDPIVVDSDERVASC
jgi:hypothetical protein